MYVTLITFLIVSQYVTFYLLYQSLGCWGL